MVHCTSTLADPKGAEKHSATVLSTLCDALEYFPIKIYDFQLKFSRFWFPAESSFPAKSETWVCKSQPPEQTPLLELYKDMAGWGWCHWRQIHTWGEYGSLCPLSNCQPLCHKKRSEMFAHIWFYQRRNNNHLGNPYELPSKMHFSSEKKVTVQNNGFFSEQTYPCKQNRLLFSSVSPEERRKEREDGLFFQFSWHQQSSISHSKCRATDIFLLVRVLKNLTSFF